MHFRCAVCADAADRPLLIGQNPIHEEVQPESEITQQDLMRGIDSEPLHGKTDCQRFSAKVGCDQKSHQLAKPASVAHFQFHRARAVRPRDLEEPSRLAQCVRSQLDPDRERLARAQCTGR